MQHLVLYIKGKSKALKSDSYLHKLLKTAFVFNLDSEWLMIHLLLRSVFHMHLSLMSPHQMEFQCKRFLCEVPLTFVWANVFC